MESDVAFFTDEGKLLKRTAPENLEITTCINHQGTRMVKYEGV